MNKLYLNQQWWIRGEGAQRARSAPSPNGSVTDKAELRVLSDCSVTHLCSGAISYPLFFNFRWSLAKCRNIGLDMSLKNKMITGKLIVYPMYYHPGIIINMAKFRCKVGPWMDMHLIWWPRKKNIDVPISRSYPANTVLNITFVKVPFSSFMDERNEDVLRTYI